MKITYILQLALLCFVSISAFGQSSYVTYDYGAYSPKGSSGAYYENVSFQYGVQPYNISSERQQEYDRVAIIVRPSPTRVFKFKYNGTIYDIADVCSDIFHHTGGSGFDMFGKFTMSISVYGAGTKNLTFDGGGSGGNDEVIIPLNRIYKQEEFDKIKVTSIQLVDIQPLQSSIEQIKRCLERKEKNKKAEQEQKLAEQKAKKEAEEREKEHQRSSSNNYSNSHSTNSTYSSTSSNRSSSQTQQQRQQALNEQQQKKTYDNNMKKYNSINESINKVNQAQQKFHNQMDQWRDQYKAQSDAEDAKWEQEKLQKQLEEEREEQERLEEERRKQEEENRKREAKADYNRRHSSELSRKREIIKTRERLLSGNEWELSPTFNLISENGESIFLFFVEVDKDYRNLDDYSDFNYNNPRISISILNNPGIVISPIIEIKPRNNGEYPFPEDIISKLKKDYPSKNSFRNFYKFHNWITDKEELEKTYNSFLNRARSTDFAITFHENKVNLQDENSGYWSKDSATPKNKTINYWDKNTDKKKTTTQSKDYWGEPAKKPAKKEAKKPDYWN